MDLHRSGILRLPPVLKPCCLCRLSLPAWLSPLPCTAAEGSYPCVCFCRCRCAVRATPHIALLVSSPHQLELVQQHTQWRGPLIQAFMVRLGWPRPG